MRNLNNVICSLFICWINIGYAQSQDSTLFNVFENLGAPEFLASSTFLKTDNDTEWSAGTEWFSHTDFDESVVFRTELTSQSEASNVYKIRIGKGGQLYSIKMPLSNLGELVPPQSLIDISPWNDEVFQATYIWADVHGEDEVGKIGKGQAHGSGMYMKPDLDPLNVSPFYGPMLAESYNSTNRSYTVANMVTIPSASINRADLLQYISYRDLGAGVLEITYYAYNFHDYDCTGASTPWGGLRHSKLPEGIRGTSGTSFESIENDNTGTLNVYNIKDKGNGWMAQTQDATDSDSWTIGFVHGKDEHYAEERVKYLAGEQSFQRTPTILQKGYTAQGERDFHIVNLSNRLDLESGEGFFRRVYMVFGKLSDVAIKCATLVQNTDYGEVVFTEDSSPKVPLYTTSDSGQTMLTTEMSADTSGEVARIFATPVSGSVPLIQMRNRLTGEYILSTDQYAVCNKVPFENPFSSSDDEHELYQNRNTYQIYDDTTEWISLLGYVVPGLESTTNEVLLSSVLGENIKFEKGEKKDANELLVLLSNVALSTEVVDTSEIQLWTEDNSFTLKSTYAIRKTYLYNTLGQEVISLNTVGKELTVNTNTFKSGVYYLKITLENNKVFSKKIIVTN